MKKAKYQYRQTIRVLFLDIVGFTRLKRRKQVTAVKLLSETVYSALSLLKTRKNSPEGQGYVLTPTGDGFVISVYSTYIKEGILLKLARRIQKLLKEDRRVEFGLRYGLNSAPGVLEVNERNGTVENVYGHCVNVAERIMSLGDQDHILMSDRYLDHLEAYEERLTEYKDVRLDKHSSRKSIVHSYCDGETGRVGAPRRLLMGHQGIEVATNRILDIIATRFDSVIREFWEKNRMRVANPHVRATVLCYNPEDEIVIVTPHSRCNGRNADVVEHEFDIAREGKFKELLEMIRKRRRQPIHYIVGLPDFFKEQEEYVKMMKSDGGFSPRKVRSFSGRSRAFCYLPLIYKSNTVGFISMDTKVPICTPERKREFADETTDRIMRHCFDRGLMDVLGHCFRD